MPQKLTQEEFIERSITVHGNKYDYSIVDYKNTITKVSVICPQHGVFQIRPSDHIHNKVGCPICSGTKKSDTKEFIEKAEKIYGNKYDYSKVEYKNNKTKVYIICHEKDEFGKEHGGFWQRPNDHLSGYECKKCKNKAIPTTDEWVLRAKKKHGNKYNYSKVNYVNANTKVCVICTEHGEFWQTPNNHLNGNGCPLCNSNNKSKMESGIAEMLDNNLIKYTRQKTFKWLKYKKNLFLDFYIPYKKIAIEVQGEQHFTSIKKFGGDEDFLIRKKRDEIKKQLCEEHDIKLFYITKRNYNLDEIVKYINNGSTNKK